MLIHDLDTLDTAVAALAVQQLSDRQSSTNVSLWGEDRRNWLSHLSNIATQKGWFPHSMHEDSIQIILPPQDLHIIQAAQKDPYQWLSTHRDHHAPAEAPRLGQDPAYITVHTSITGIDQAGLYLLGAVFAAIAAAILFFFKPLTTLAEHI